MPCRLMKNLFLAYRRHDLLLLRYRMGEDMSDESFSRYIRHDDEKTAVAAYSPS